MGARSGISTTRMPASRSRRGHHGSISDPDRKSRPAVAHDTRLRHRQRPDDLLHEQRLRMRRGSENLYAAGREIDDEDGVVRDETLPGPDFCREEIGPSDAAPVRLQERLP